MVYIIVTSTHAYLWVLQKYYYCTKNYKLDCSWYESIQKVKTQYFSDAQGEFSRSVSASDGLHVSTASTSADLVGLGLTCWSHSLSISRRQLLGIPLYWVSIALRRPWLSCRKIPMFIHSLLTGSKILNNVGRLGGLSDVFAAEAALDEPCALPPPPSIIILLLLL